MITVNLYTSAELLGEGVLPVIGTQRERLIKIVRDIQSGKDITIHTLDGTELNYLGKCVFAKKINPKDIEIKLHSDKGVHSMFFTDNGVIGDNFKFFMEYFPVSKCRELNKFLGI